MFASLAATCGLRGAKADLQQFAGLERTLKPWMGPLVFGWKAEPGIVRGEQHKVRLSADLASHKCELA